jgi:cytidylate kinase
MTTQARLEVFIDIFEHKKQRAQALVSLKPNDFVAAILDEFNELEYLGNDPKSYRIIKKSDGNELADDALQNQLRGGEQLALVEHSPAIPSNASAPSAHLYLREQSNGKLFKLNWLPALIGRPDSGQNNEELAVNLSALGGLRVSRRHAQIVEKANNYYVEQLSSNPLSVRDSQGTVSEVKDFHPLQHGDVILLERSQLALKFIIRPKETTP